MSWGGEGCFSPWLLTGPVLKRCSQATTVLVRFRILSLKTAGREPDDVSGTRCGWIPGNLMIKLSLGLKMVKLRAREVTEITWLVQGWACTGTKVSWLPSKSPIITPHCLWNHRFLTQGYILQVHPVGYRKSEAGSGVVGGTMPREQKHCHCTSDLGSWSWESGYK